MIKKPSLLLAIIGWGSLFALTWVIVMGIRPLDGLRVAVWFFFLGIALIASAMFAGKRRKP